MSEKLGRFEGEVLETCCVSPFIAVVSDFNSSKVQISSIAKSFLA